MESDLMQLELQKSGANQKRYRCDRYAMDVSFRTITVLLEGESASLV